MYFIELLNFDSLIYRRHQIFFFAKQILKVYMLYFFIFTTLQTKPVMNILTGKYREFNGFCWLIVTALMHADGEREGGDGGLRLLSLTSSVSCYLVISHTISVYY